LWLIFSLVCIECQIFVFAKTGDVQLIRGVEVKFQPFYNSEKDFTCLDGSITIPFNSVNDDYCDCPDGSDEPGTAACPGGRYYCFNIGFKPQYIPSSRVNDGICDCCDGSDEYDSDVVCFNECEKLGEADQAQKKEQMAETMEGTKLRAEYMQSGKEKKEEKMQRIDAINKLLEERRTELEAAKALKDEAEEPEKRAKEQHKKEWEDQKAAKKAAEEAVESASAFGVLDVNGDGWISVEELLSHHHLLHDMKEEEAKELLGGVLRVDKETLAQLWTNIKPKFTTHGRPEAETEVLPETQDIPLTPPPPLTDEERKEFKEEVKPQGLPEPTQSKKPSVEEELDNEETRNFENDLDGLDDLDDYKDDHKDDVDDHKDDDDGVDDHDDDDLEDDDDEDDDDEGVRKRKPIEEKDEAMPEYDENVKQIIGVADKARTEFEEADKAVRELEREKRDLDEYMKEDFGLHEEFSPLKGQCFELTDREYVYKLCPYGKATQKNKDGGAETNLGSKMVWVDKETNRYTIQKYEAGAQCWNGPARSTTVYLSCGSENKLTYVNEPSRCEYEMHFKTPALCDEIINHDEL